MSWMREYVEGVKAVLEAFAVIGTAIVIVGGLLGVLVLLAVVLL